jgi:hypothetical protein
LALALVLTVSLAGLVSLVQSADAVQYKRIVLGQATQRLEPNCGRNFSRDCIVEGNVTAYQVFRKDSPRKRGWVVPWTGKIVSWSISLSRPTKTNVTSRGTEYPAQRPFFNQIFGSPASARIAVLRRVDKKKKGPPRWKMVRQSPVEILNPYFGRTVHFTLTRPLNVIRDQMVALTIPTWAPALWQPRACAFNQITGVVDPSACARAGQEYTWRGSRAPDKCNIQAPDGVPNEALRKTAPQTRIGSKRTYGCYYGENALLYTATVIGRS